MKLISVFSANGISGWRRNYPVKGHPDFVFLKEKIAVFVDGCFWHGHDCRNTKPADNKEYWDKKRERNMRHDKEVTALFRVSWLDGYSDLGMRVEKKNANLLMEKLEPLLTRKPL